MGRSWSREWGQGGGSLGLPSGPAPQHHPAAPTPPVAIYSPIFPQKKLLRFIWDAGRFAGQQSPCCEHRLDLPLVGAPWALHQLLGHTRRGTAPAARTRGAPRAAVPAAPWLSPEHQGGREKPPEKPPVRREAAGPRRLGLWDKKSLRWLCWLFVDSSWLSWGLKATLKLSKQTLISQFSQPACNLSLALLYRGGGAAPSCGAPSALSTRSSSSRGTAKGRGLKLSPCHSITHPSLIKHPASSRDWHRQALGQGEGGTVPDGAERRGKCPTPRAGTEQGSL